MPEVAARVRIEWGVAKKVLPAVPGPDRHIALYNAAIGLAAISTPVLVRLSPTCLSFDTSIAVLAVPVLMLHSAVNNNTFSSV